MKELMEWFDGRDVDEFLEDGGDYAEYKELRLMKPFSADQTQISSPMEQRARVEPAMMIGRDRTRASRGIKLPELPHQVDYVLKDGSKRFIDIPCPDQSVYPFPPDLEQAPRDYLEATLVTISGLEMLVRQMVMMMVTAGLELPSTLKKRTVSVREASVPQKMGAPTRTRKGKKTATSDEPSGAPTVKRYIDVYSASSLIGFSNEDLLHLSVMYAQAMENWSSTLMNLGSEKNESCHVSLPDLKKQIDLYLSFLASVAELARSKWTQFNLKIMIIGFGVMLISLLVHVLCIRWLDKLCGVYILSHAKSGISHGLMFSCLIVAIRACSFLSNSYILEEGKVACFLAGTTAMLKLRYSITKTKMQLEVFVLILLITVLRFCVELGLSKQAVSSGLADMCPSWMLAVAESYPFWSHIAELPPVLALIILAYMLHESISRSSCRRFLKFVIRGTIFSYLLIAAYWASESKLLNLPLQRNYIAKGVYVIDFGQLSFLSLLQFLTEEKASSWKETLVLKIVAVLSALSSTIIILSGRQGPMVALASIAGGWCIMRLGCLEQDSENGHLQTLSLYSFPVTQWSLLAVCLFFCTGHWCAFDGLHYAAAFIGFEEFIIFPQAILLTIDTFGFSHILPIFGLPFLALQEVGSGQGEQGKGLFFLQLCQVYLMYGLVTATTATFTMLCVAIQRRHLMVWGLFAPKFVFDVLGLLLTDFLIVLALLYYRVRVEDDGPRQQRFEK